MGKLIDITGQRFGRLTVIKKSEKRDSGGNVFWVCRCECGNIKDICSRELRRKSSISCGCYNREHNQKTLGQRGYGKTHGKINTKLYRVYRTMITRCCNKNCEKFKNYGERGITICTEWRKDFQLFYDWAMSHGYKEGLTIERIDVNGNYCPENCEWIPSFMQAKNKTTTHKIKYNNSIKTIEELSVETGISYHTIYNRYRKGYDIETCLKKEKLGKCDILKRKYKRP